MPSVIERREDEWCVIRADGSTARAATRPESGRSSSSVPWTRRRRRPAP